MSKELNHRPRLELADGAVFCGESFGAAVSSAGEVVFTTGMVGYPQTLTDPSYKGQIIVFTYPLIGNYGISDNEKVVFESGKIHAAGVIVADVSRDFSHWDAKQSLSSWLREQNVPALTGIDTRALTKKLREQGVMLGRIALDKTAPSFKDPNKEDLAGQVTIRNEMTYPAKVPRARILLIDCGCKENIVRSLVKRECEVIRVPYDYDSLEQQKCDGIVISNGPGDPKMCKAAIAGIRSAMQKNMPIFGICLGNQVLALAAGADTYKMKFGHRGQNQPCVMLDRHGKQTERCFITSQNHGFAVDTETLRKGWLPWFVNANDGTNEGIRHRSKPWMSTQFHVEHSPGPTDTEFILDEFLELVAKGKGGTNM